MLSPISKAILLAVAAGALHVTTAMASIAPTIWFCQTCDSTEDAENFVVANAEADHFFGHHTVEVINLNTSYTWFIEFEYLPSDYPFPEIDSASPGTANDDFVAATAIAAEEQPVVIDIAPGTQWASLYGADGFQTLSDWEPELLYHFAYLAWQEANANLSEAEENSWFDLIMEAIEYHFGHGPEVTVVFSDGSTAKFMLDPLHDDIITIIAGSGRHADGTFYPFGPGGSDGDPYHVPTSGGFILNYTDSYYSCGRAYQDSKPYWLCTNIP